ncbi:Sgn1p LALA0_S01e09560g [Lachancea lanzarotensis]|uniref:LALA0S01e09560g1_1 n=1 Tax=Lachancea lanzarotensis TaxID=1245769 RepID=A0A0C7N4H5_9SACH|nr:uncharacterized protein LALA0_S01e09560g [Lachancea lanzarotensis]CEP60386.1 LALA0S01e09560g1_1 [Lachancea lanzarotensis]
MNNAASETKAELLEELESWSKHPVQVRRLSSSLSNRERKASVPREHDKGGDNLLGNEVDSCSIFLRNISTDTNASVLEEKFQRFGTINRITIFSRKSVGKLKCYAYIEFDNVESADRSLALNKSTIDDRTIDVLKKRNNVPGWRGNNSRFLRGR